MFYFPEREGAEGPTFGHGKWKGKANRRPRSRAWEMADLGHGKWKAPTSVTESGKGKHRPQSREVERPSRPRKRAYVFDHPALKHLIPLFFFFFLCVIAPP